MWCRPFLLTYVFWSTRSTMLRQNADSVGRARLGNLSRGRPPHVQPASFSFCCYLLFGFLAKKNHSTLFNSCCLVTDLYFFHKKKVAQNIYFRVSEGLYQKGPRFAFLISYFGRESGFESSDLWPFNFSFTVSDSFFLSRIVSPKN